MTFIKNITPNDLPDMELVAMYKSTGDLQILSGLYQRYMELVYGVCLKYLQDSENSKDAVINIFEQLISKLKQYEVNNFKAWLYQLAKNHCLMKIRSEKKFRKVDIDMSFMQNEESLHLNSELEKEENLKQLQYCLGKLDLQQKTMVELFYMEGKCYNEIVEITGIDWNKIRSYIQNGKRNLKICLDKKL